MEKEESKSTIEIAMAHLRAEERIKQLEEKVILLTKDNNLLRSGLDEAHPPVISSLNPNLDRDIDELVEKRRLLLKELDEIRKVNPEYRCRRKSSAIAGLTFRIKTLRNSYKYTRS